MIVGKLATSALRARLFPLMAMALVAATVSAKAEEIIDQQLEQPGANDLPSKGPWNVILGLGGGFTPRFEGASAYRAVPIPYAAISYAGIVSIGPAGITANLIRTDGFRAGLLVGYSGGRDQDNDPHLQGLGDISPAVQMGGFASYRWNALEIRAQARQAVTHASDGMEGSLGVSYTVRPTADWMIKAGPQLVLADGNYIQKYFSVTANQSQSSGLPTYSAGGGLRDVSFGLNSTYQLSPHWLLFGIARLSEMVGDAADSPIVQNKEQAFGGAGLAYHF